LDRSSNSSPPSTLIESGPRVSGQFLHGPFGPLATVIVEPPRGRPSRFAVLYVPPAGDEMNKSRRMSALQARALADLGATVAMLDLRGTGDSAGDHGDATWNGWREDVQFAWDWLGRAAPAPRLLWGTRLGGLLAADLVHGGSIAPHAVLLWQPVVSGASFFNQWLRLTSARQLTATDDEAGASPTLRRIPDSAPNIEVGGYRLHPDLIRGAQSVNLAALDPGACAVVWRDVSPAEPPALSAAAEKIASGWRSAGRSVDIAPVAGGSFWASQEIVEVPALVTTGTEAIARLLSLDAPA
jgi:exosortase A-associated hydrolase 2